MDLDSYLSVLISSRVLSINEDLLVDVTLHMSLIWESCSIIAYSSLTRNLILGVGLGSECTAVELTFQMVR